MGQTVQKTADCNVKTGHTECKIKHIEHKMNEHWTPLHALWMYTSAPQRLGLLLDVGLPFLRHSMATCIMSRLRSIYQDPSKVKRSTLKIWMWKENMASFANEICTVNKTSSMSNLHAQHYCLFIFHFSSILLRQTVVILLLLTCTLPKVHFWFLLFKLCFNDIHYREQTA